MIGKAFYDFWRAATAVLLLFTIAAHASQPAEIDFDFHPAPFSAYDDDVILASLGARHNDADLTAVKDVEGGNGKLPALSLAIHLAPDVQFRAACGGRSPWFLASPAESLRSAIRYAYLARGPPLA